MAAHGSSNGSNATSEDGELVAVIGVVTMVVFAVIIWFRFRAEIVTAVRWIYGLIATPFYAVSVAAGDTIASAVLCFLLVGLAGFFAFKAFKNKKGVDARIGFAVVFAIWGITELVLNFNSSLVLGAITTLCKPEPMDSMFPLLNCSRNPSTVGFIELGFASIAGNMLFAVKRITEALGGFFRIGKEHPDNLFKKKHTVDSFIEEMKVIEPHLRVFSSINPNLLDSEMGDLRNMDGTRRFCYRNNLISNFRARVVDLGASNKHKPPSTQNDSDLVVNDDDMVPEVDEKRFVEVMTEQLGDVWVGLDNLSAGELILMAITVPKVAAYDEEMSGEEFDKIAEQSKKIMVEMFDWTNYDQNRSYKDGEIDEGLDGCEHLGKYREFVDEYIDHPEVVKIINSHAYNRTVLISMMTKARGLGIIPPAEVRWLWMYDRTLWYTVQNIDRPSYASEGLGAMSHWLMEQRLGIALHQPSFDVAYYGLSDQLAVFKYTKEDEQAWKDLSEKRKKERFYTDSEEDDGAVGTEKMYEAALRLESESIEVMKGAHDYYPKLDKESVTPPPVEF